MIDDWNMKMDLLFACWLVNDGVEVSDGEDETKQEHSRWGEGRGDSHCVLNMKSRCIKGS
jgi:hypothetical protein